MTKKIIGYSDRISVAAGETVHFHVSCDPSVERYDAAIVRVTCGDTQPGAPGMKEEPVRTSVTGTYPARFQPIHPGIPRQGARRRPRRDRSPASPSRPWCSRHCPKDPGRASSRATTPGARRVSACSSRTVS